MNLTRKPFKIACISVCLALSTAPTHALPILAYPVLTLGAHSLYTHYFALPFDGGNHYNLEELEQALNDLSSGIDIAKNVKKIRKNLYYLYTEGLCGHASRLGSPRFNDKTGLHEIPFVPSRGVYGWISDRTEPVLKTAEFVGKTAVYLCAINKGYDFIDNFKTITDKSTTAAKMKAIEQYKPVTKI